MVDPTADGVAGAALPRTPERADARRPYNPCVVELPHDAPAPDAWYVCPVLGLAGDREHRLATWHPDHRCWAGPRPVAIERGFQATVCTTRAYTTCPAYAAWAWGVVVTPPRPAETGPEAADPVELPEGYGRVPVAAPSADPVEPPEGRWRTADRIRSLPFPVLAILGIVVVALVVLVGAAYLGGKVPGGPVTTVPKPTPSPIASTLSTSAPTPIVTSAPTPVPATPTPTLTPTPATPSAATPAPRATPKPKPSEKPTATPITYRVKSGDTLSSIAEQFGTTVKAIVDANGITDPSTIIVGQKLVIPVP